MGATQIGGRGVPSLHCWKRVSPAEFHPHDPSLCLAQWRNCWHTKSITVNVGSAKHCATTLEREFAVRFICVQTPQAEIPQTVVVKGGQREFHWHTVVVATVVVPPFADAWN